MASSPLSSEAAPSTPSSLPRSTLTLSRQERLLPLELDSTLREVGPVRILLLSSSSSASASLPEAAEGGRERPFTTASPALAAHVRHWWNGDSHAVARRAYREWCRHEMSGTRVRVRMCAFPSLSVSTEERTPSSGDSRRRWPQEEEVEEEEETPSPICPLPPCAAVWHHIALLSPFEKMLCPSLWCSPLYALPAPPLFGLEEEMGKKKRSGATVPSPPTAPVGQTFPATRGNETLARRDAPQMCISSVTSPLTRPLSSTIMVHEKRCLAPPPATTHLLITLTRRAVEWSLPVQEVLLFYSVALVALEAKAQLEQWGMRWKGTERHTTTTAGKRDRTTTTAVVQDDDDERKKSPTKEVEEEESDENTEKEDDEKTKKSEKTTRKRAEEEDASFMAVSEDVREKCGGPPHSRGGGGTPSVSRSGHGKQQGSGSAASPTGRGRGSGKRGKRRGRGGGGGGGSENGMGHTSSSPAAAAAAPVFSFTAFIEDVRRWKVQRIQQCADASHFILTDTPEAPLEDQTKKEEKKEEKENEKSVAAEGMEPPLPTTSPPSVPSVRYVLEAQEVRHGPATTPTAAMCLLLYAADEMEQRRGSTVTADRPAGGAAVACSTRDSSYLIPPDAEADEEVEEDEEDEEEGEGEVVVEACGASSSASTEPKRKRRRSQTFNFSASSIFYAFAHTPARFFAPASQPYGGAVFPSFPFPMGDATSGGFLRPPPGVPSSSSSFTACTSETPLFVPFVPRSTPRHRHPFQLPPLPPDPLQVFVLPVLERLHYRCLTTAGALVRVREWLLHDAMVQWGKVEKADEVVRLRNWKRLHAHREAQAKRSAARHLRVAENMKKKGEETSGLGCVSSTSSSSPPRWTPSDEVLLNDGTFLSLRLRHTSFIIRAPVQWSWRSTPLLLRPSSSSSGLSSPLSSSLYSRPGEVERRSGRFMPHASSSSLSSLPRFFCWDGVEGSILQYGVGSLQQLPPLPPPLHPTATPNGAWEAEEEEATTSSSPAPSFASSSSSSSAPLTARQVRRLAIRPFLDNVLPYDDDIRRGTPQRGEDDNEGPWQRGGSTMTFCRHVAPKHQDHRADAGGGRSPLGSSSSSSSLASAPWKQWWWTASFASSSSRRAMAAREALPTVEELADFLARLAVPLRTPAAGGGDPSVMHLLSRPHAGWVEAVLQREWPEVYRLAREKGMVEWRIRASCRSVVLLYVSNAGKEISLGPPARLAMKSRILYPPPPPPPSSSSSVPEESGGGLSSGVPPHPPPHRLLPSPLLLPQQHEALQTSWRRLWRAGEWADCHAYVQRLLHVKEAEAVGKGGGHPWVESLVLAPHPLASDTVLSSSSSSFFDVLGCIPPDTSLFLREEKEEEAEEEEASTTRTKGEHKHTPKRHTVVRHVTAAYPLRHAEAGVLHHILSHHPQAMGVMGCGVQQMYLCTAAAIGEWTDTKEEEDGEEDERPASERTTSPTKSRKRGEEEQGASGGLPPSGPKEEPNDASENVVVLLRRSCGVVVRLWSLACCYASARTGEGDWRFPVVGREGSKTALRPLVQAVWIPQVLPLSRLPATSGRNGGQTTPAGDREGDHIAKKKNNNTNNTENEEEESKTNGTHGGSRRITRTAAAASPPLTRAFFDGLLQHYLRSLLSKRHSTTTSHGPPPPSPTRSTPLPSSSSPLCLSDPPNERNTCTVKQNENEDEKEKAQRPSSLFLPPPPSSSGCLPFSFPGEVREQNGASRTTLYPTDRHLLFHVLRHHPRYLTHVKGCGIREIYIACRKVDRRTDEEEEMASNTKIKNPETPVKQTEERPSEPRWVSSPPPPHGEEEQEVISPTDSSASFSSSSSSPSPLRPTHRSLYRPLLLLEYVCGKVVPANTILAECFGVAPPHTIVGHQEMVIENTNEE